MTEANAIDPIDAATAIDAIITILLLPRTVSIIHYLGLAILLNKIFRISGKKTHFSVPE